MKKYKSPISGINYEKLTKSPKRKNIDGNLRGSEDKFFTNIIKGLKEFLRSPF